MPTRIEVPAADAASAAAAAAPTPAGGGDGGGGGKKRRRRGGEKSKSKKNNGGSGSGSAAAAAPESLEQKVARSVGGRSGYGGLEEVVAGAGGGGGGRTGRRRQQRRASTSGNQNDAAATAAAAAAALANRKRVFQTPAPAASRISGTGTAGGGGGGGEPNGANFSLSSRNPYRSGSIGSTVSKQRRRSSAATVASSHGGSAAFALATPGARTQHTNAISHVVCAVSENLARETCVASLDAGAPVAMQVTKQANGQTYAETLAYLEVLQPDEVLLNEGRRNSQLVQKILALYDSATATDGSGSVNPLVMERGRRSRAQIEGRRNRSMAKSRRQFAGSSSSSRRGGDGDNDGDDGTQETEEGNNDDLFRDHDGDASTINLGGGSASGACRTSTVIKFVPRAYFDQTRGADLLRRVAREGTYDATVVEEYILLSAAYAVMQYSQHCLGASFCRNALDLVVNSGGSNRMTIDRSTLLNLELLSNARTGKTANSLIGTIDSTKTSVGARLLRTNIMAPPTRVDTINARLNLVGTFLEDEEFFYVTMEHLQALPDIDRVLSHMALKPKAAGGGGGGRGGNAALFGNGEQKQAQARMASRGIAALVCIKSTLGVIPTFAKALDTQLKELDRRDRRRKKQSGVGVMSDLQNGGNGEGRDDGESSDDEDDTEADERTFATERSSLLIGLGGDPGKPIQMSGQSARHQLLRAILLAMKQPALKEILDAILDIFTESTTYTRNSHAMRHQECFALKPNTDGMMDVYRKAFLANVDDIYRLADEYAEQYGFTVAVKETTARGYFLSIPADMADDIPAVFIQPVKSGRFVQCTSEEVLSLNARAQENVQDLLLMTNERIQEVLGFARERYDALASLSDAIALLDLCHCFADNVASSRLPWSRPKVTDCGTTSTTDSKDKSDNTASSAQTSQVGGSGAIAIRNGRYAIDVSGTGVMLHDGPTGSDFVPNDTYASAFKNFTVITGVNGSGKSTYLKQIAIIVILGHCGSYVPAEEAFIPLRDRLCTRIGTSDDQEHNISTFMLEMKETAFICNNATNRSLILIDELGRATSNEDGVAIAWAVSEFLLVKRAMTFFVTHYPHLSKLASVYSNVQNQHLGASVPSNGSGDIKYSRKIQPGPCRMAADYGVEMAATCGWPVDVVVDARMIRAEVEKKLPDGALVEDESGKDRQQNIRRRAEEVLSKLAIRLVALKESAGRLSVDAKRSYLHEVRDFVSSQQDQELVEMIKKLLSEEESNRELSPIPLGKMRAKSSRPDPNDDKRSEECENEPPMSVTGGEGEEDDIPDGGNATNKLVDVADTNLDKSLSRASDEPPGSSQQPFSDIGRIIDKIPAEKERNNPRKTIDGGSISSSSSADSSSSTTTGSRLDTPKPIDMEMRVANSSSSHQNQDQEQVRMQRARQQKRSDSSSSSGSSSSSSDESSSSSSDDDDSISSSSSSSSDSSLSSA